MIGFECCCLYFFGAFLTLDAVIRSGFSLFSSNLFCTISLSVFVYQEYRAASHLMKYFQKLSDRSDCSNLCFKHSFHRSLAIIAGTVNHRRPCSFTCTFPQSLSFGQFSCYIFLIRFYCLTLIDFSIFNSIDHWKIHWIHRTNKNIYEEKLQQQ